MYKYLPIDTQMAATTERLNDCQNLGLLLDKFQPWKEIGREWKFSFKITAKRRRQWEIKDTADNEAKGYWLSNTPPQNTKFLDSALFGHTHIEEKIVKAALRRWGEMVVQRGATPFLRFTASRLIVGLGNDTVIEIHLRLHHVHGYPFIPGTVLKGIARTAALHELAAQLGISGLTIEKYGQRKPPGGDKPQPTPLDKLGSLLESQLLTGEGKAIPVAVTLLQDLQSDDAVALDAPIRQISLEEFAGHFGVSTFRSIFGSLDQAGGIVFFDSLPAETPKMEAEIMNAHYPKYYTDPDPSFPHDSEKPNLITYLAVGAGVPFGFAVAGRPGIDDTLVAQARVYLDYGLQSIGIGAKTAAGHGLFAKVRPAKEQKAQPEPDIPTPNQDPVSEPIIEDLTESEEAPSEFANSIFAFMQRNQGGK